MMMLARKRAGASDLLFCAELLVHGVPCMGSCGMRLLGLVLDMEYERQVHTHYDVSSWRFYLNVLLAPACQAVSKQEVC
jgi:hypothetical protein